MVKQLLLTVCGFIFTISLHAGAPAGGGGFSTGVQNFNGQKDSASYYSGATTSSTTNIITITPPTGGGEIGTGGGGGVVAKVAKSFRFKNIKKVFKRGTTKYFTYGGVSRSYYTGDDFLETKNGKLYASRLKFSTEYGFNGNNYWETISSSILGTSPLSNNTKKTSFYEEVRVTPNTVGAYSYNKDRATTSISVENRGNTLVFIVESKLSKYGYQYRTFSGDLADSSSSVNIGIDLARSLVTIRPTKTSQKSSITASVEGNRICLSARSSSFRAYIGTNRGRTSLVVPGINMPKTCLPFEWVY